MHITRMYVQLPLFGGLEFKQLSFCVAIANMDDNRWWVVKLSVRANEASGLTGGKHLLMFLNSIIKISAKGSH